MRDGDPGDDGPREDGQRRSESVSDAPVSFGASPLVLYVHERSDKVRELTGGGTTADGICLDIRDAVSPGGVWHGMRYEDLGPGRYSIVGNRFVREDGDPPELRAK